MKGAPDDQAEAIKALSVVDTHTKILKNFQDNLFKVANNPTVVASPSSDDKDKSKGNNKLVLWKWINLYTTGLAKTVAQIVGEVVAVNQPAGMWSYFKSISVVHPLSIADMFYFGSVFPCDLSSADTQLRINAVLKGSAFCLLPSLLPALLLSAPNPPESKGK